MSVKPSLRAVQSDEKAPASPKAPKTVAQAAKSGTPRELLVAMRDRIAETVSQSNCAPRDLAALTRRLQDIAKDIDAIDARGEADMVARARELELALREFAPNHVLLLTGSDVDDDKYDPAAI